MVSKYTRVEKEKWIEFSLNGETVVVPKCKDLDELSPEKLESNLDMTFKVVKDGK